MMILMMILCLALGVPSTSFAIEKYGRTAPAIDAPDEERISGYLMVSVFALNNSFAARPNNTGLTGSRYMLHLERDVLNHRLTLFTDQNFLTDKTMGVAHVSEWDGTYGMRGSITPEYQWRLQYERDSGVDQDTISQSYASLTVTRTWGADWIDAYVGVGGLLYNNQYFARPNNTGRALLNYIGHVDFHFLGKEWIPFVDAIALTDRNNSNVFSPTELDWIVGLAYRQENREIAIFHEQDRPIDTRGLVQQYLAIQLRYSF